MAFCVKCGKEIADDSAFCPNCGARVNAAPAKPAADTDVSPKKRLIAALLAYFLGGIGLNDFYLGKRQNGFAKILMFFVGIFAIITSMVAIAVFDFQVTAFYLLYGLGCLSLALPSFIAFVQLIMILCGVTKDINGKLVKDWI